MLSELPEEQSRIRVAAFVKEDPRTGTRVTYCTDGLRDLGIRLSANLSANLPANQQQTSNGDRACDRCVWGSEITLQLQLEPLNRHSRLTLEERELQLYPCRALTVAWTLLRSTVDLRLEPGLAMSAGTSLFKHFDCPLRSIFCTPLSFAHEEQRAEDGNFYYVNLACLTDDEADACRLYGSEYIKKILRYKGFDQITRPVRLSVLHRTGFSESLSG